MNRSRRHSPLRRWLQLDEVLVGLCLAAVLAGLGLELAGRTWRYCREAIAFGNACQDTQILGQVWRDFVHACPPGLAISQEGALVGPVRLARVDGGVLVLATDRGERRVVLPRGSTARIQCETGQDEPARWILSVTWNGRRRQETPRCTTRLVACERGEPR